MGWGYTVIPIGLTAEEARLVAAAIRERLLPTLGEDERVLLDGRRTTEPDDCVSYREPAEQHKNYSSNRRGLETRPRAAVRAHCLDR